MKEFYFDFSENIYLWYHSLKNNWSLDVIKNIIIMFYSIRNHLIFIHDTINKIVGKKEQKFNAIIKH